MNEQRLMQVLLAPQISEKATYVADKNQQVIFRVAPDARTVRRLLSFAHPDAGGVRVRAGLLARSGEAVLAVRIPEGDVTLPVLNQTFAALWRLATEIGGAA